MRLIVTTIAAVALLAGCGSSSDDGPTPGAVNPPATTAPATSSSAPSPASSATPTADPYDVYLAHIPKGEPTLSREDASTRALLGCGKTWPPGTTDAVLAEAYAAYCK